MLLIIQFILLVIWYVEPDFQRVPWWVILFPMWYCLLIGVREGIKTIEKK